MSAEEYQELIDTKVRPMYEDLKRRSVEEGLIEPKAAYGYFRCYSEGDSLIVEDDSRAYTFGFPRQSAGRRIFASPTTSRLARRAAILPGSSW